MLKLYVIINNLNLQAFNSSVNMNTVKAYNKHQLNFFNQLSNQIKKILELVKHEGKDTGKQSIRTQVSF